MAVDTSLPYHDLSIFPASIPPPGLTGRSYASIRDYVVILEAQEGIEQSELDPPYGDEMNIPVLWDALVRASEEIDGRLRGCGFTTPVPIPQRVLSEIAVRLARMKRETYGIREDVEREWEIFVEQKFTQICSGELVLFDPDGNPIPRPIPPDPEKDAPRIPIAQSASRACGTINPFLNKPLLS